MAFQNKNLSVIAYANGFTLWHYKENATLATITASGYLWLALMIVPSPPIAITKSGFLSLNSYLILLINKSLILLDSLSSLMTKQ